MHTNYPLPSLLSLTHWPNQDRRSKQMEKVCDVMKDSPEPGIEWVEQSEEFANSETGRHMHVQYI